MFSAPSRKVGRGGGLEKKNKKNKTKARNSHCFRRTLRQRCRKHNSRVAMSAEVGSEIVCVGHGGAFPLSPFASQRENRRQWRTLKPNASAPRRLPLYNRCARSRVPQVYVSLFPSCQHDSSERQRMHHADTPASVRPWRAVCVSPSWETFARVAKPCRRTPPLLAARELAQGRRPTDGNAREDDKPDLPSPGWTNTDSAAAKSRRLPAERLRRPETTR